MKLAIDLGGTNLRIGQIDNGRIINQKDMACPQNANKTEVLDLIKSLTEEMMNASVDKIGIGVPSVVDVEKGIVYDAVNIPSWKEVHLKEILENIFHVPVCVDNDVNCFVLGEKYFGSGKAFHDFVGITLGTGVGAGIMIDDKLYRGINTGAGEVGSLPYLQSDYEHYCSSLFFKYAFHETGKELAEEAFSGDKHALKIWQIFGGHLGKLMQALIFTYDPQAVIIGGGMAKAAPFFAESMKESMAEDFPYKRAIENIKILFSTLDGSNMLGASKL
ncbi:MAG: ROK family protein [Bacteroidaceae bacterium]|nr:ROK family protein [Bacteroidaceae bacterium]